MAYAPTTRIDNSPYLSQYLNTASNGNAGVEFSIDVNRYRLFCKRCKKTQTYGEEYALPTMYEKDGMLDASIQKFAKEHRHDGWVSYKVTLGVAEPSPRQKQVAVGLKKCPRRPHERKFKP